MKQYLTELRGGWRGARWIGPIIEAPNFAAARVIMRETPYKVVGEVTAQPLCVDLDHGHLDCPMLTADAGGSVH